MDPNIEENKTLEMVHVRWKCCVPVQMKERLEMFPIATVCSCHSSSLREEH